MVESSMKCLPKSRWAPEWMATSYHCLSSDASSPHTLMSGVPHQSVPDVYLCDSTEGHTDNWTGSPEFMCDMYIYRHRYYLNCVRMRQYIVDMPGPAILGLPSWSRLEIMTLNCVLCRHHPRELCSTTKCTEVSHILSIHWLLLHNTTTGLSLYVRSWSDLLLIWSRFLQPCWRHEKIHWRIMHHCIVMPVLSSLHHISAHLLCTPVSRWNVTSWRRWASSHPSLNQWTSSHHS